MSAGTQNFDKRSAVRPDRNEPPAPTRSHKPEKPAPERLRIVRVEEPAIPTGRTWEDVADFFGPPRHSLAEQLTEQRPIEPLDTEEELVTEALPPREPGVDLATVQPRDVDTTKLAAFVHAIPVDKKDGKCGTSPSAPSKAIAMPMANTDLQEIFQADKICMVSRSKPPAVSPAIDTKPDPLSAVGPVVPSKKTPRELDATEQYLVDNWPKLPPNVQTAILNVIEVAIGPDDE
jgi:hypothetical protein